MMKFSCEKVLLQNAITVASRAVAPKSSIPALEGLLLHADSELTVSGYDMKTGIRTRVSADVTEGGDIVLNARLFGDIIRRIISPNSRAFSTIFPPSVISAETRVRIPVFIS